MRKEYMTLTEVLWKVFWSDKIQKLLNGFQNVQQLRDHPNIYIMTSQLQSLEENL